jgi:hypothetical protein
MQSLGQLAAALVGLVVLIALGNQPVLITKGDENNETYQSGCKLSQRLHQKNSGHH